MDEQLSAACYPASAQLSQVRTFIFPMGKTLRPERGEEMETEEMETEEMSNVEGDGCRGVE